MNNIKDFNWDMINSDTCEGQLLKTAICTLAGIKFKDKTPMQVLGLIKDIRLNPIVDEPFEETFERLDIGNDKKRSPSMINIAKRRIKRLEEEISESWSDQDMIEALKAGHILPFNELSQWLNEYRTKKQIK